MKLVPSEATLIQRGRKDVPLELEVVPQNVKLVSLEVNGVPRTSAVLREEWMTLRGKSNIVLVE